MNQLARESEQRRLMEIASEYEADGYEVKVRPASTELPEFLRGFETDLIAIGNGESVAVQVKTRSDLGNEPSDGSLENALRNRPGWRFELIIEGATAKDPETVDASQIRASLNEADELQRNNHMAAALLLLWSGTEGALRRLAMRENVELESLAPAYILKRLYTLGLLSREQYSTLSETVRIRNRAAHGFDVSIADSDLTRISSTLRELLTEVETTAA